MDKNFFEPIFQKILQLFVHPYMRNKKFFFSKFAFSAKKIGEHFIQIFKIFNCPTPLLSGRENQASKNVRPPPPVEVPVIFFTTLMPSVISLTIGYNRAVNPRRFRCMDLRCESKLSKINELLLLELATIAVRM